MSQVIHNRSVGRGRRIALLLLPIMALPLAAAGVTSGPVLEYREACGACEAASRRSAVAAELREQLAAIGSPDDQIAEYLTLAEFLSSLVPEEISTVSIYSRMRQAAQQVGLSARSIRIHEPERFDGPRGARIVGVCPATVQCTGTLPQLMGLVDQLRTWGMPLMVDRFTLGREGDSEQFHAEIELGLFHYVSEGTLQPESDGDSPMPGTEPGS